VSLCVGEKEFLVLECWFPSTTSAQILDFRFSFHRVLSLIILQNPDDTRSMAWQAATDRARLLGMKALWRPFVKSVASGRRSEEHFWPRFKAQPGVGRRCEGVANVPGRGARVGAGFLPNPTPTEWSVCRWYTARFGRHIFGDHSRGLSGRGRRAAEACRRAIELRRQQDNAAVIRHRVWKPPPNKWWDSAMEVLP
jgi:hypothetical protein